MNITFITEENCPLNLKNFIKYPPAHKSSDIGNNVLHFNRKNRHYEDISKSSTEFVKAKLTNAKACISDSHVLYHSIVECAKKINSEEEGVYLEFGFCSGKSINFIGALAFDREVYGFDSGNGLPEMWRNKFEKGTFGFTKKLTSDNKLVDRGSEDNDMPFIPFTPLPNVKLCLGLIQETLPEFKKTLVGKHVEFIYIDTDLYSTAKVIFDELEEFIIPGKTVIVLDEGYNFIDYDHTDSQKGDSEWKNHEFRAMEDFCIKKKYKPEYLAFNENLQQLALLFQKI